jgi:putative SOS response-associated peptidase YedK
MCGRYVIISSPELIRQLLGYLDQPNFPPRYNVAPTQPVPVVRIDQGQRFALLRWGLIPSWVKDPRGFTLLINARGETVNVKPAFRNAMKRRRCLLPADGFYEWKGERGAKHPYFVRRKDRMPFAFAGLWESWIGPNGEEVESAAIVTTQACPAIMPIHDRMPVILGPDQFERWLDCAQVDEKTAATLIAPIADEEIEAFEVSSAVNRVANDSPELIAPLSITPAVVEAVSEPEPEQPRTNSPGRRQGSLF